MPWFPFLSAGARLSFIGGTLADRPGFDRDFIEAERTTRL